VSVAGPQNTIGEILSKSVRPNVNKFSGEIGVNGRRAGIKLEANGTGDLEVLSERRRGIDEDIIARLTGPLVEGSRGKLPIATAEGAPRVGTGSEGSYTNWSAVSLCGLTVPSFPSPDNELALPPE
jgi:hypothetical protein